MGIEGDIDSFNPLFAEDENAGEINDLLYPALTGSSFNSNSGKLEYQPLIARSWDFSGDGKDIIFHLRSHMVWSDGVPLTAHDVQYSYELYADTTVASVRQSSVEMLRKSHDGILNIKEAIECINDSTIVFHFDHVYPGQLFDAGLPILPSHIVEKIPRASLHEDSISHYPLSAGPFMLKSWKPMEQIELAANRTCMLLSPAKISELIYRVIPDYHTRLMQLTSGDIDIFPYINVEDAVRIQKKNSNLDIISIGERFYDAINWNNIDPSAYEQSKGRKVISNPLFGDLQVRRALTMAINRKEIIDSYLQSYGRESIGPISPLFRWAYNDTIQPLPFDPDVASSLLAKAGWHDPQNNGVLEKNGKKFSFTLTIPSGDEFRSTIATIVQSQLKAIKIEVKIEQLERSVFWNNIMEKKFDACIAGFSVPLQMQLDEFWGSDLQKARFNITSFRNKRVDEILTGARQIGKETDYAGEWKEFQVILHQNQPCTFLYWMNDLVAVNKRIHGTQMGILGVSYHAGDWYIK